MQIQKWNQILAFAFSSSLALGLLACNSTAPDKTPPTYTINLLQSQGKYLFGITDTIAITFSEKIDTSALAVECTPSAGIANRFIDGNRLQIYGKNQTYGTGHFNINSPFTAVLTGLRDTHGNGLPRIETQFSPFPWVDRDRIDSTFSGIDTLFLSPTTWMDGSPVTDSLTTEGELDFKKLSGILDYSDLKVMTLTGGDTLFLSLTTRKDLDLTLKVAGPYSQAGLDSIMALNNDPDAVVVTLQTGTKGVASAKIPADLAEYKRKFKDPGAQGLYLIILRIPQFKEGFYQLGTRIHAFQ